MVVRVWTTGFDPARLDELNRFANTRSLPMFRRHDGCLGVIFAPGKAEYLTISFWRDHAATAALEASEDYKQTVAAILAEGFLRAPQNTQLYDYGGGITPQLP
mgnify:CR=1 FL=1